MKRLLLVFFILPLLTTCEMFDNDMPAFLDFYSGTAKIESHIVDGSHLIGNNNKVNISPESARTITFHMNNPQKYDLNLGINWDNSLLTRTTAEPPEPDDYTLVQNPNNKSLIHLTFTKEFLDKTDKAVDGGDISATISLTESKSGREFESYKYSLESNSPPPHPEEPMLMKESADPDAEYVLCFKLPNFTSDPNHRDITKLTITDNSKEAALVDEYDITLEASKLGDKAITKGDKVNKIIEGIPTLEPWLDNGTALPDQYAKDENAIFYITNVTAGNYIDYTVTLIDDNGLISEEVISNEEQVTAAPIDVTINEEDETVLHDGKYYTKKKTVTLTLSVKTGGVTAYQITDKNSTPNTWEPWNGNSPISHGHTLTKLVDKDINSIYIWVKDNIGNTYRTTVTVTYVTTGPIITVAINEGDGTYFDGADWHTRNNTVTLNLSAEIHASGVAGYKIRNNKTPAPSANSGTWEDWDGKNSVNSKPHYIKEPSTPSTKSIYVWVKDNVGNISAMQTITVNRIPSISGVRATINMESGTINSGGAYYTKNSDVTLNLSVADNDDGIVVAYQITNTPRTPDTNTNDWEDWDGKNSINSPRHTIATPTTPGEKTIHVWTKDNVKNVKHLPVKVTVPLTTVYLKPSGGNDSNNGTAGAPVRTMNRAIALLGGNTFPWNNATIMVMSTIPVTINTTWKPKTPLTLKRSSPFTGVMVNLTGGTLTLENIILDGERRTSTGSLIIVRSSTLSIGNGVKLQNNNFTTSDYLGGGVFMWNSTLIMFGNAAISHNIARRGGGVYMSASQWGTSTTKMYDDAVISYNTSTTDDRYFGGGGVFMWGSEYSNGGSLNHEYDGNLRFYMNDDAAISHNVARRGGGVFMYGRVFHGKDIIFSMADNTEISKNTSTLNDYGGGGGGGVHIIGTLGNQGISRLNLYRNALITENTVDNSIYNNNYGGVWGSNSTNTILNLEGGRVINNNPNNYQGERP